MLAKKSGGNASYAKIAAARALKLPVFLVKRPPIGDAPAAASVDQALALLDQRLGLA